MHYEHKSQRLAPREVFVSRVMRSLLLSALLTLGSLALGAIGYHVLADLGWVDALENAAMILTGMGPVSPLAGDSAKLFATGYALFSGLVYVTSSAILLAPIAHRFLHRLHAED
jgi:hypothetical protein